MEPKKWSLFVIVGTYSIGTFSTLKVGLVPMETTCHLAKKKLPSPPIFYLRLKEGCLTLIGPPMALLIACISYTVFY